MVFLIPSSIVIISDPDKMPQNAECSDSVGWGIEGLLV